jgi:Spy/CpxP family protein refolding chaperone
LPDKGRGWLPVAVAVLGLAIGFAASSMAYRHRWLGVPRGSFMERMQRALNLTPAQRDQILAIVNETRPRMMKLREDFEHQRHETIMQARARVRALLTPEQQEKFDHEFRPPPEHEHDNGPGMHGADGPHEGGPPPP